MRTNLSSSTLVRLLAQATSAGSGAPQADVAERLSQWLTAFDAVALHGLHQQAAAAGGRTAPPPPAALAAQQAVLQQFQRIRKGLINAIHTATARPPEDEGSGYSELFKRHLELQREMALKIAPLRAEARQTLARSAKRLRTLAAMDALLEQAVGAREHKLLAQVPVMLEKRFEQLRSDAGEWPTSFAKEWEAIALAELHLRLQPVVGMMEAWGTAPQTTQ